MNDAGFERVWKDFPRGGAQLTLMLAIAEKSGENGACEVSLAELAERTRMPGTSLWRTFRKLSSLGWISADRHKCSRGKYNVRIEFGRFDQIGSGPARTSATAFTADGCRKLEASEPTSEAQGDLFTEQEPNEIPAILRFPPEYWQRLWIRDRAQIARFKPTPLRQSLRKLSPSSNR